MTEFFNKSDLIESLPYLILTMGSFVILMLALFWKKKENNAFFSISSIAIVFAAFISFFYIGNDKLPMNGLLAHNQMGFSFSFIVLFTLMLVIPMLPYDTDSLDEVPSSVTSLLLLSACGALIMINSNHLLMFFIGLELLSLPLYVLTGLGTKKGKSSEASFKYFLLGSVASAIFIYGTSLVWASLGTVYLSDISEIFASKLMDRSSTTLWMGFVLIAVSLFFKLGAFPFHFWIPDVYQAAPSSIVAWMSGVTKSATMLLLLKLLQSLPVSVGHAWVLPLSLLAIGSMLWGSFGALFQTNVRRMLGYSTIAHVGYSLIAVLSVVGNSLQQSASILAFYFLVYGVSSLISFTIISSEEEHGRFTVQDYAGMAKRSPEKALYLALSLLSLAGLPPLGGFMGKFNIFYQAIEKGYGALVLIAVMTSLLSLGYYLNFLVKIYMETGNVLKTGMPLKTSMILGMASVFLLILGIYPKPIFELFSFLAY